MHRHLFGLAVAVGCVSVAGCATDPTGDLSGVPERIVASLDRFSLLPGDSVLVTAELLDAQGVPLATLPEPSTADASIAVVVEADRAPLSQKRFYIKGVGAGLGRILLTSGTIVDTVTAIVFPLAFDGAATVASGGVLDTVTITSSAIVGFDTTGSTTVSINDEPTYLVSRTDTELKVLALNPAATTGATITLHDVVFLPGVEDIELDEIVMTQTVDLTGDDSEPGNDASGGANVISVNAPFVGSVSADDTDDWLAFTLAADGAIGVTIGFEGTGGDPDIDARVYNSALTVISSGTETGAQPEVWTSGALTAGTYYVRIIYFDSGDADPPHWYRVTITTQ